MTKIKYPICCFAMTALIAFMSISAFAYTGTSSQQTPKSQSTKLAQLH